MKKKLEIIVLPKHRNRKEFSQSLENLSENLQNHCSYLKIDESVGEHTYTILTQWSTTDQMRKTLRSEEFLILSGAVNALCEKTVIRIDDKEIDNHISNLIKL